MASAPAASMQAGLPTVFAIALERLKETVSKDDAREFTSTTIEKVWTTMGNIQRQSESRKDLPDMRRVQPFLVGIENFSKVVDVLYQATEYVPYLWITQGHSFVLEQLIYAYAKIGEVMPLFDKLTPIFKDGVKLPQILGRFYENILEFHRRAYMFFRRPSWKIGFGSNPMFGFQEIRESFRVLRDLIDEEVHTGLDEWDSDKTVKKWDSDKLVKEWDSDKIIEGLLTQPRSRNAWKPQLAVDSLNSDSPELTWEKRVQVLQYRLELGPSNTNHTATLAEAANEIRQSSGHLLEDNKSLVRAPTHEALEPSVIMRTSDYDRIMVKPFAKPAETLHYGVPAFGVTQGQTGRIKEVDQAPRELLVSQMMQVLAWLDASEGQEIRSVIC